MNGVLVTGTREELSLRDRDRLHDLLNVHVTREVVVHVGDCPSGVDRLVREWCEENKIEHIVFEADWTAHGRSAGPRRNSDMVNALAWCESGRICLAFPASGSQGTWDCLRKAVAAGIVTHVYPCR